MTQSPLEKEGGNPSRTTWMEKAQSCSDALSVVDNLLDQTIKIAQRIIILLCLLAIPVAIVVGGASPWWIGALFAVAWNKRIVSSTEQALADLQ